MFVAVTARVCRPPADACRERRTSNSMPVQPVAVHATGTKRPDVEQAVRAGVRFLKAKQQPDGSWADVDGEARTGMTSLVTLALLSADEPVELACHDPGDRIPQRLHARSIAFGLRGLAPDEGFRRGRPQSKTGRDRRLTWNGSKEPRSNPAIGSNGRAAGPTTRIMNRSWRQLEYVLRPAGIARGSRGRLRGQSRGLDARQPLLERLAAPRRRLGLHCGYERVNVQHDVRRDR